MIYPFYVFQNNVENHVFWVAKSASLKGVNDPDFEDTGSIRTSAPINITPAYPRTMV